jgi:aspartate racemase
MLELRVDGSLSGFSSVPHTTQPFIISQPLTESLKALSEGQEVPLSVVLLATFQVLLYRYTNQSEIAVGLWDALHNESPLLEASTKRLSGQSEQIKRRCDPFILATYTTGESSYQQLLAQVSQATLEAQMHEDISFDVFTCWEAGTWRLKTIERELNSTATGTPFPQSDLTLHLVQTANGQLVGKLGYRVDRFDAATINLMAGHFQTLLESVVANPGQSISRLPMLTPAETHQLVVEWNNTQADYPQDLCIHQWFEAQVEQTPDAVAVIDGERQLTYRELNGRANQLARYLQTLGVGPGENLAIICMERSLEMVVTFLGVHKAGAAYVPIDPNYPHERRAYKLSDSQANVILTQEDLVTSLPAHTAQVVKLDADWNLIAQQNSDNLPTQVTPQSLAYVIYTSGSTGKPKGVMITHQGVVNHSAAIARQFELQPSDRVLQFSTMSFDIIVEEVFPSLISGATIILRSEESIASTSAFLTFIETNQITILDLPTAFWHELVNGLQLLDIVLPSSVRLVVVGGEKASRSTYQIWRNLVGQYPRWLNTYGPTETTVTATVYDPIASEFEPSQSEIPIGRPIANTQIYLLDQHLQPVPVGFPGELYIGGAGLSRGYLHRPELNARKFSPNPFSDEPGARLYKTGDTARYLPSGDIEFIGRIDYQVKIRGFRIELVEIETALEQHPDIQQAIVLAQEESSGQKRLVAYLLIKQSVKKLQAPTTAELIAFLQIKLPDYMLPTIFVTLETLPVTPNGKVDRQALPVPKQLGEGREVNFVPPRNDLEFRLVKIWETVLKIQPIGIKDNFFELGGNSLLAARLSDQIEKVFNRNLPLTKIFEAPTVEKLAKSVRREAWSMPDTSIVAIQSQGNRPPLFLCEGVCIYHPLVPYLGADQPLYGLVNSMNKRGKDAANRVQDLAGQYIQEIRAIQPKGPYYLAGLSFGGIVAFEVAQRLIAEGQDVALLALFDTVLPDACKLKPISKRVQFHLHQLQQFGVTYVLEQIKGKLEFLKKRRTRLEREISLKQNLGELHVAEYFEQQELNDRAEQAYQPQAYPGKMVVFRASDREDLATSDIDPELGWGKFALGELEIFDVPGDHLGILKEPNVSRLGKKLKLAIDQTLDDQTNP